MSLKPSTRTLNEIFGIAFGVPPRGAFAAWDFSVYELGFNPWQFRVLYRLRYRLKPDGRLRHLLLRRAGRSVPIGSGWNEDGPLIFKSGATAHQPVRHSAGTDACSTGPGSRLLAHFGTVPADSLPATAGTGTCSATASCSDVAHEECLA